MSTCRVLAVVTDRDIVVRVVAEGGSLSGPVGPIATKMSVICVTPDMSTSEASELMSEHQDPRLPVVENDRLVGSCDRRSRGERGQGQPLGRYP